MSVTLFAQEAFTLPSSGHIFNYEKCMGRVQIERYLKTLADEFLHTLSKYALHEQLQQTYLVSFRSIPNRMRRPRPILPTIEPSAYEKSLYWTHMHTYNYVCVGHSLHNNLHSGNFFSLQATSQISTKWGVECKYHRQRRRIQRMTVPLLLRVETPLVPVVNLRKDVCYVCQSRSNQELALLRIHRRPSPENTRNP